MKRYQRNIPIYTFCLLVLFLAFISYFLDRAVFIPMLGGVSPFYVFPCLIVIFLASIEFLKSRGWLFQSGAASTMTYCKIYLASVVFGCLPIVIDLWKPFPEDMNVLFPASLFYYPSIGFVAEIFFHIVPLLFFVLLFDFLKLKNILGAIILVAMVEPVFQVYMEVQEGIFSVRSILVGIEVLLFSMFQIAIFRKYGFLPMYVARIGFYTSWHLVWGSLRLI